MGLTGLFQITLMTAVLLTHAAPNLLLVFLDQWRWDWAGFDDANKVRTPTLASIASKGTRFTHAFTPAPLCAPARGALASGKEYDESPVPDNMMDYPVDGSCPTYYSQLQEAGYHVMMAGKDHLTMALGVGINGSLHANQLGFDDWERTPDKYEMFQKGYPYDQFTESLAEYDNGSLYNATSSCYGSMGGGTCCDQIAGLEGGSFCPRTQPAGPDDKVYPDAWTEASAEKLIDRRPSGKPWFMQVGFPGPHPPFILTDAMNASVAGRTYSAPQGSSNSQGDEFYQVQRRQYAAEIENLDSLIGKLFKKLETLGELDNTVVAIAADHGELLGDYNLFAKSKPWDGAARVPLLFMGPNIKGGAVISQPVSTLDIVGTFLESAGAQLAKNMTTQSMWPMLSTGKAVKNPRSFVRTGLGSTSFVGEVENEDHLSPEFPPGGSVNWRMVVKQMNDTSTLKLVCCPSGCSSITGNTTLFPSSSVGLFEVSGGLEVDLLSQGIGHTEAAELALHLPSTYQATCSSLLGSQIRETAIVV